MIKDIKIKRPAFTMLELVFVIVALGIIAVFAMPKLDRDRQQEAADVVLSNIRYTQHLALLDNKQKFDDNQWQREFWRIEFESCASGSGLFFAVGSDLDHDGSLDQTETALDPANSKPLSWTNTSSCASGGDGSVSENIFITKKYGVNSVAGTGGCSGLKHIGFDHLGRPHVSFTGSSIPDNASYMSSACTFTFTMEDSSTFAVTIQPETGYAQISIDGVLQAGS